MTIQFNGDGSADITNVTDLEGGISGDNISAVMTDTGSIVINGRTFVMTETPEAGVTVTAQDNTFAVTHAITQSEADEFDDTTDDDIGKLYEERVTVSGDDDYTINCRSWGYKTVEGLTGGASVNAAIIFDGVENEYGAEYDFVTDSEGEFTFGDTTYTITGDDSVSLTIQFNGDGSAEIVDVNDLEGYVSGNGTVIGAYEIENSESGVVEGSKFNDTINNSGENVTIDAGAGNDVINNTGDFAEINAGAGNDTVISNSDFVTISGGDGDDFIENNSTNAVINAGDGNNTINNTAELSTITAGAGDDLINNNISAENESADEGDSTSAEIDAGDGANTINNDTENATILSGAGDDIINNSGSYAIIDAGDGANSITNSGVDATITSGAGNDTIITDANSTIQSGNGNDYISVSGAALINTGAGNSTIDGYNENVTIQAGTLRNSSLNGNNLVLRYNDAAITIIDGNSQAINLLNDEGNLTSDIIIGEVEINDTGTVNGVEFTGTGTVSVNMGAITLAGDLAVDTDAEIVISGESNITIGSKVFSLTDGTATVETTSDGFVVNGAEVTVLGDSEYGVIIDSNGFISVESISASATVLGSGEYIVATDERGSFTLGENIFTVTDDAVVFSVANDSVRGVYDLSGTVSGDFDNIHVNDNVISVSAASVGVADNSISISANAANVTLSGAGDINLSNRQYAQLSDTTLAVFANDSSFAAGSEAVSVYGDRSYTVIGAGAGINSVTGISGGATVTGEGTFDVITDSQGQFSFDKNYSVAGDTSVDFAVNNGSVRAIDSLDAAATISGEFTGVSLNGGVINISGDSSVAVVNTSSGLDIRNVSANATVNSAGGAYRVTTDEVGAYNILGEKITVTGDSNVIFEISDSSVSGVSNISNATVAVDAGSVTLAVNDAETVNYHSSNNNGELVIGSAVQSVSGVDSVAGLTNATVHATSSVTVNGAAVNVSVDNNYDVVVEDSAVVSVKNINANSTLAVNNVSVQAVEEGAYTFGSKTYTITEDAEVNFAVNGSGEVENISGLTGGVNASEAINASINGVDISVSDASATIYGSSRGISNIDGLSSNATVQSSSIDNILIAMSNGTLTANDIVYELSNDSNGAYVAGKVITNLDSNASLKVDSAATYTVNGSVLNASVGDIIIGASDGSAYIYDPNNIRIDDNTTTEEIIEQLGVDGGYAYTETNASAVADLIESGNLDGNMSLVIGAAAQNEVDFSESSGRKLASVTSGAHNVSFNDEGGNIAVIDGAVANAEGIELGDGGDIVVVEDTGSRVSIVGGAGADTIINQGGNVVFDMEAGGADKVVANGGTTELENYSDSTGAGVQTNYSDIAAGFANGSLEIDNDGVTIDDAEITFDSNFINLYNSNAELQKVGYSDGGTLNASSIKSGVVLIGEGNTTLIGGTGNDTVLAGEGVVVDAGAGNNYVLLDSDTNRGGATIEMTAKSARTTVDNFNATFDDGDMVNADSDASITFDGSDITVKSGRNRVILNDVGESSSADETDDFGSANSAQILIGNSRSSTKTEVVAEGAAVTIGEEVAESYIGKDSGLDLSEYDGDAYINLGSGRGSLDNDAATFSGFNRMRAGTGESTLYGSSDNETIYAGAGGTTIYGGGGRDTLIAYSGDDKESGSLFRANTGKATIEGFEFLTEDNEDTADKVDTFDQVIEDLRVSDSDLTVTTANGRLMLLGGAGQDIKYSREGVDIIAQVNKDELIFDGTANYYEATGKNATVTVDDGLDNAEIWLDNSHVIDFEGDIKYLDASGVEGETTLVGNSNNNVITASAGDSSLWGGTNGNDTLIGGDGDDMFWYFYGNGNDSISGADNNDTVNLADVTFDMFDVSAIEIGDNSIKVNFHDGGSVALDTNDETTFTLGDGSSWVYDKDDNEWKSKS